MLDLRIARLERNLGFATANNIGARLAHGNWLALLNPDAFPAPDWLAKLLAAAESHPGCFFASRQIQNDHPDRLDGEGDAYHVSGLAWRRNYGLPLSATRREPSHFPPTSLDDDGGGCLEVFSACGAAALYPRQAFLDAGGFDEDFFAYHEDVDLGFRLRLLGLRCLFVPEAVVHHVGSAASGKMSDFVIYHGHRNLVWTYFKNMPSFLFWAYLPLHLAMNLFFLLSFSLKGRTRPIWRAKRDALGRLGLMLRKRQEIQGKRHIPARDIYLLMERDLLAPLKIRLQPSRIPLLRLWNRLGIRRSEIEDH